VISEELQITLDAVRTTIENCDILIWHNDVDQDIKHELLELRKIAERELAQTEERILLEI
jgi:hypothetical protein